MKSIKLLLSVFVLQIFSISALKSQDLSERIQSDLKSNLRISLILPLSSKNIETGVHNNFIDFYQGVLIAVEDSKKNGMNIDLAVFDSDDYDDIIQLSLSGRVDSSDFIIGPIYAKDIEKLLPYANEKKIPLISPLDPKSEHLTNQNPYLFQTTTPIEIQQTNLLSELNYNDHTIIIHEAGSVDKELTDVTLKYLNEKNIAVNIFSYFVEKDKSYYNKIVALLKHDKLNNIIIPSNSEAFVYDVLRNLNLMCSMEGYNIKIYGTPRWRNFELVDLSYFHSMNLSLSLTYYVDYTFQQVKDFLFRYRALFQNEPSAYAFQAYDVTCFFLNYIALYGKINDNMTQVTGYMLQSDFSFIKKGEGYINSATKKIEYLPGFFIQSSSFSR